METAEETQPVEPRVYVLPRNTKIAPRKVIRAGTHLIVATRHAGGPIHICRLYQSWLELIALEGESEFDILMHALDGVPEIWSAEALVMLAYQYHISAPDLIQLLFDVTQVNKHTVLAAIAKAKDAAPCPISNG